MDLYRKNARVAGALFIAATVAGMASVPLLGFLNEPDYLINASQNEGQLVLGTLLVLVMAFAGAGIPISLYPILRTHSEARALASVVFRATESMVFVVAAGGQLSVLALGRAYVSAGTPDASYFQTMGTMISAARTWFLSGTGAIAFCLGALMYYWVFYQSQFVPRWLSLWGLVAVALHLSAALLVMFGEEPFSTTTLLLNLPVFVNEMVLAVWLIAKGFGSTAKVSGSVDPAS